MAISIFLNKQNFPQIIYNKEDEFEELIIDNAATIFGDRSIYIDIKHRIESSSLGGVIPDGILIDLSDLENPEFYLVEVELQIHDFFKHIFPQITKFFAFYKNSSERQKLTEKIFSIFKQDDALRDKLKKMIGSKEIYKFLKDTLENSQNILIIIDGLKSEFEEIMDTYTDTWGKMVKVQIINHFRYENQNIITAEPPFQNLEFGDATTSTDIEKPDTTSYTEEFHLEGCNENVRNIYNRLKQSLLKIKSGIRFNPTKYYIGVYIKKQFTYIQCYKKKLKVIVYLPENEVRETIHSQNHIIKSHSEPAQRFWGGSGNNPHSNCAVEITDTEHFDEIESLLQKVVANNEES
jgi:predicted transport protein